MKIHRVFAAAAILACGLLAPSAFAYDWAVPNVHVRLIEVSYMPSLVQFETDVALGSCPAGTWIKWNNRGADEASQIASANAIYTALVTAMAANRTITAIGNNANCSIDYLYIA